jgi:hypothetical protein
VAPRSAPGDADEVVAGAQQLSPQETARAGAVWPQFAARLGRIPWQRAECSAREHAFHLQTDEGFQAVLQDVFASKVTSTLGERASDLGKFLTWCVDEGREAVPVRESDVFDYAQQTHQQEI